MPEDSGERNGTISRSGLRISGSGKRRNQNLRKKRKGTEKNERKIKKQKRERWSNRDLFLNYQKMKKPRS